MKDLDNDNTLAIGEIFPMTFEEKVKMYMKLSKEELAKMLAERDSIDIVPQPYIPPTQPYVPPAPFYPWQYPWITWSTSSTSYEKEIPNQ